MRRKLARLASWRAHSHATDAVDFTDDDGDEPIDVVCCPEKARAVLTGPQPAVSKGEFQRSPFYALLGPEWLAYLDGPAHVERRRQVLRLLRRTRERINWHHYQTELVVTLRRLLASGGVTDLFSTLAVFSSYQLGRALFGDGYTFELNRRVRGVWAAMNDIADEDPHRGEHIDRDTDPGRTRRQGAARVPAGTAAVPRDRQAHGRHQPLRPAQPTPGLATARWYSGSV